MKNFILFLSLIVNGLICFAQQNKMDSLITVLNTAKEDTNKVNTLNNLSNTLCQIGEYEQAKKYSDDAFKIAQKINFKKGKADACHNKGDIYSDQGNYPEGLKNYIASLKFFEDIVDTKRMASSYNNIGNIYFDQGNYPEALKNFFEALKIFEDIGSKEGIANSYNNIGIIYKNQGNYNMALKNQFASLKIYKGIVDKLGIAASYNNIGNIYKKQGNYPEALKNYFASLKLKEELSDKKGMANSYGNIGDVYEKQSNYTESLKNYFASLKMFKEMGNKRGIGLSYVNLSVVNIKLNKLVEAKSYLEGAVSLAKEIGNKDLIKDSYSGLSTLDSAQNNWKGAYEHYKLFMLYRDSIYNEDTKEKTIQASMNYEFEKKEALNKAEQDKKDALAAIEINKQQINRYAVSGILVLVILFTFFLYNRYRLIGKQKNIIELKEKETQIQKHVIEEKHKEITDSINYAERIQRSFLATTEMLDKNLSSRGDEEGEGGYFVFFKAKDVVSGDFYWAGGLNNGHFALCCADSTGHGVPGAIMSILNISSLEKSIEQEIEPNKILNTTRKIIIDRLKKDGSVEGGKDGMDCSLLIFNKDRTQLTFAAANNPIFIVRRVTLSEVEMDALDLDSVRPDIKVELMEFKADKMPVGRHAKDNESFSLQTINLQKGDIIYTLTDGFADQFGGDKGKKYMIKNLKELLLQIAPLSMPEQEQKLAQEFTSWKGDIEQVDDVCVIGVRV